MNHPEGLYYYRWSFETHGASWYTKGLIYAEITNTERALLVAGPDRWVCRDRRTSISSTMAEGLVV